MALLLSVLIPEPEQKHLINIVEGKTKGYKGGHIVRSELRHLRSIGLIRKHPDRNIGELRSDGVYDLADIVELTNLGLQWVAKLKDKDCCDLTSAGCSSWLTSSRRGLATSR